jgi:2-(1,2-epoxy-1,2-dihydrophenyl)acetyl-CoA isomerase
VWKDHEGSSNVTEYTDILVERQDGVVTITLNRPDRLNAMTWHSWDEFMDALRKASEDDDSKAVVITGAGRGFCSGSDLMAAAEQRESPPPQPTRAWKLHSGYLAPQEVVRCNKPIIAAVNGTTAGAGFGMALACDIRIASEAARFSAIFVRRGLSPDFGCSFFLPRIVGLSRALELMYTGEMIDAQEALRLGLVSRLTPPDQLLPTAMELASRIAAGPSLAIEATKRLVYRTIEPEMEDHLRLEEYWSRLLCQPSQDAVEGVRSFLEKRDARFQGR